MAQTVKPVPDGYHTLTPYIVVRNAARAIDFYKRAFGAQEMFRMEGPGGGIAHAELKIGDSMIMISDEFPGASVRSPESLGGTTNGVFLYVSDIDAAFKKAVDAGAKAEMQPADMFWGDRFGKLMDPFGQAWSMATHVKDVTPEEMKKGAEAAFAEMAKRAHPSS
jgi:PhnB protein